MALINNGLKRGSKVIVEKYINDVMASGYPKTYNALLSFPGYNALTESQFAQLSGTSFNERMNDFQLHIESEEAGSSFNNDLVAGFERRIWDTTSCPRGW
jgi:hypothetical protein